MKLIFLSLIAFIFMLSSCDSPQVAKGIDFVPAMDDTGNIEFIHELGAVRKTIEQSAGMYSQLSVKQCPYKPSVLRGRDNDVATSNMKAMRFGMYGASFVYAASYNQPKNAADYLQVIVKLGEELGLENTFDKEQLKLLYQSDPEVDKSMILTKAYLRATEQLYDDERALLVSFMVFGGWIEGMSMSYDICGEYLEDESIRLALYDQTYSFYNCLRILKTFENEADARDLIARMEKLEPVIEDVVKSRGELDSALFERVRIEVSSFRNEIN